MRSSITVDERRADTAEGAPDGPVRWTHLLRQARPRCHSPLHVRLTSLYENRADLLDADWASWASRGDAVPSRQVVIRGCAVVLALAAAVVAVLVAGVEKWVLTAVLAGASAAVTGLVTRNVDRAFTRGSEAVLARSPEDPITVHASQVSFMRGYIGPLPPTTERWRESANVVELNDVVVHLIVEASGDRTAVISKLDVRVESCDAPPHVSHLGSVPVYAPMAPRQLREFRVTLDVGLSANAAEPAPLPRPADGVPDFPYMVAPLGPDHFFIHATTEEPGDFRWRIGVHWICNGQSGVIVADHDGQPFRVVHPERSPRD